MKYKIIILIAVLFSLTNCEKYLDQPVLGKQTVDNFYSNEDECKAAVIATYQSLSPESWWEVDFFWLVGDICSDDAFKGNSIEGDQTDFGYLARWIIDSNNEWLDIKWRYSYITISRANLVIEHVANAPIDENLKQLLVAEAKFLRGLGYFELAKNFGGVVLVSEQPQPDDVFPRSTIEETWAFIKKDFSDAAAVLPERKNQAADYTGRATMGAALAYLARTCLYEGNYTDAETYAKQVIDLGDYSLEPDFGNVWNVHNPNGVESIFEIQAGYHAVEYAGNALSDITGSRADGGWGFCTPSSHLENFMQGDPRLPHTIIKHGDNVDAEHPSFDAQLDQNESGRINKKYYLAIPDRIHDNQDKGPLNHILFRYADLLLIHAESAYRNGNESVALTSLNEVRDRVGLGALSVSGQALLNAILDERRMELAMEGHRYYDLKRTGKLEAAMTDFVDYNLNRSTDLYDAGNRQGTLFDATKHYLFPIPQSEIDLSMGIIKQNPNY